MIDIQTLAQEVQFFREARIEAEEAGQWLEDLIEQLHGEGRMWRHLTLAAYSSEADTPRVLTH